jgi:hypothetical protein
MRVGSCSTVSVTLFVCAYETIKYPAILVKHLALVVALRSAIVANVAPMPSLAANGQQDR